MAEATPKAVPEAPQKATLCFLIKEGKILLIRKKRGIGAGKYNAPGGRIEPGESPADGARREVLEEIGVSIGPKDISERGLCIFYFGRRHFMDVRVFVSRKFSGTPRETAEADPFWFPMSAIPYGEMWADDAFWLPLVLRGKRFEGTFRFDSEGERLISHRIRVFQKPPRGSRARA